MKKAALFSLFILLTAKLIFAQINKDGLPFVEVYTDKNYGDAGQIWAITQDQRGVMYFGCNYGLKTYDGKSWKGYHNMHTTIIRSLAVDENDNVYYGAEGEFGIIIPDSTGGIEFYSLYLNFYPSDRQIDFSAVWKTYIADGKVWFQSVEKIFYTELPIKIDKNKKLLNKIQEIKPDNSPFHLSFAVHNQFYVREWEKGLCKVENGKSILVPGGEQFALMRIYSMLPFDDKRIIIATWEGGLFLFDPEKKENSIVPFVTENDDLIKGASIYSGTVFRKDLFIFGTINSGIVVINKAGKILMHLNETNGYPNQMVLSSFYNSKSDNGILWFFYDGVGVYKANVAGPFYQWNMYNGLDGLVSDIQKFNGDLWVSASDGLYKINTDEANYIRFSLVQRIMQAWDLLVFESPDKSEKKLLLGAYDGVFEIQNGTVIKIASFPQAFILYQSKRNPANLYVSTSEGIALMTYENGKWINKGNHQKISLAVRSIYENNQFLAVGTNIGVLMMNDFYDQSITVIDSTRGLPLLGLDFRLYDYKDKTIIASGGGIYEINMKDTTAVPFYNFGDQFTNKRKAVYSFFEMDDSYWMSVYEMNINNANHKLIRLLNKNNPIPDTVFAMMLPPKTNYFAYPDEHYVWIGNEKGLFKYDNKNNKNYNASFNTLISKVTIKEDSIIFNGMNYTFENDIYKKSLTQKKTNIPILKFNANQIIFEWAAPFFEKEEETEYSYRLLGETETWSKWDKKSDTRYTNLWEGEYTFQVKARNIYTQKVA
jgi:ligand-binding sensor domain-containing protein